MLKIYAIDIRWSMSGRILVVLHPSTGRSFHQIRTSKICRDSLKTCTSRAPPPKRAGLNLPTARRLEMPAVRLTLAPGVERQRQTTRPRSGGTRYILASHSVLQIVARTSNVSFYKFHAPSSLSLLRHQHNSYVDSLPSLGVGLK
jgi:hypothetical protein